MAKKRGKIDEKTLNEVPLVSGGSDFGYCTQLFLENMEIRNLAYHTRRWHRENLHYIKTPLEKLHLHTEPINIEEKHSWRRKQKTVHYREKLKQESCTSLYIKVQVSCGSKQSG